MSPSPPESMELRAFAEQVLFATTLEQKLWCPDEITDEQPGSAINAPARPGRPAMLQFKTGESSRAFFPGAHRLEQERERGQILHCFANHELLATELMALVLLRFPGAPAAFRRGVFQTLKDEQQHTKLYLTRMAECGVQFGELPVSGYFWRALSRMENPIDYVAGLSLTFEQANLDFAQQFARAFEAAGDRATADLLGRIYRDEIAHVAYGLKWFRRWKNPDESDWEAFCRQLKFPLSPQRAKGFVLNVEGRRAAGLEPEFIAQLNIYAQSKGRTPSVFVFNPFAEGYIAHGKSFTPIQHQAQLARDLANLPQFLCAQDDIVLVPKRPSVAFLSGIKEAGFALPEFVELKNGGIDPSGSIARRKLAALRPWAWAPDSHELLSPIFANVTGEHRASGQRFNDRIARLYSKSFGAALLRKFLSQHDCEPWLCTKDEVGTTAATLDEAIAAVEAIRNRGHHKIVVKQALGLAGHNSIRLWEPELLAAQRRWIERACAANCELVIEPWLEREVDFSVQFEMTPHGLDLCGYTGLINDRKGQFLANWAAPNCRRRLPDRVTTLFEEPRDMPARLHGIFEAVRASLETELRHADYLGPIGVDAFVYRTPEGGRRLKPVVEVNPRYTMGRLALELMKRACPGSFGLFRLINHKQAQVEGFQDFSAYADSLRSRWPLRLRGEPVPRIHDGALCLNDPLEAKVCLAVFEVSRTPEFLRGVENHR